MLILEKEKGVAPRKDREAWGGEKSRGAKQILDKALQSQTRALVSLPTCRPRGQRPGPVKLLCSGAAPLRRELGVRLPDL